MKKMNLFNIAAILFAIIVLYSFATPERNILNLRKITSEKFKSENIEINQVKEGIEINILKGQKGMISFAAKNEYWDLTNYKYISIELENKSEEKVRFDPVLIYDNPRKKYLKKKNNIRNEHIGFLEEGENLVFNCTMIRDAVTKNDYPYSLDFKGMKGIPEGVILNFAGVDASRIKKLNIEFPAQDFDRTVILKRVFKNEGAISDIYTGNRDDFFPFINKYGQYKHADWEGKITDDSQFKLAIEKENKELEKYKGSEEWDAFGGYKFGPKFEATGHFRTEKIDNKWWIIDPEGHLFWSTGINGAGILNISTPTTDREHFFEELPSKTSEQGQQFYEKNSYLYGKENLYRKYGENSEHLYTEISLKRMKSWGLNTLGGWSADNINEYKKEVKLPYTLIIHENSPSIHEKFPDVFNPKWKDNLEAKLQKKVEGKSDDPYLFGIFINNEIHWKNPQSFVVSTLANNQSSYGKKAYIELLKTELSTIDKFNQLAGSNFNSWDELLKTRVKPKGIKIAGLKKYNIAHYTKMCATYFKISKEVIDKYAPGKMYIGCRWHGNHKNEINTKVGAQYLDILSFNAYHNEIEFYPYPSKSIDKPFIISEFNFGALDTGKFFTGLGYASNQRNRGEKYVNFVEGALRNPRCVGTHWFMWANSTTAGKGNGENANCGVVSATDQPYYELIKYMRDVNYNIYKYRLTSN